MLRHLAFAFALVGIGALLAPSSGVASPLQCEDRGVNCLGGCPDRTGGAGDLRGHQNMCRQACSRRLASCLVRDAMIRRY